MKKKDIERIESKLDELIALFGQKNVNEKLERLERLEQSLSKIHIDVKDIKTKYDQKTSIYSLEVSYSIPVGTYSIVATDKNNGVYCSEIFRAINELGFLSFSDMEKINDKIIELTNIRESIQLK